MAERLRCLKCGSHRISGNKFHYNCKSCGFIQDLFKKDKTLKVFAENEKKSKDMKQWWKEKKLKEVKKNGC